MSHSDDRSPQAKRRKLNIGTEQPDERATQIISHAQFRKILAFQQSATASKQGVSRFKDFLISINQAEKEVEKTEKLKVLKAYCDSQIVRTTTDDEESVTCFPDMIQTWSFADNNNYESLLTAVPSVLALFIKTVSSHLDFRNFALALCKFLLQKDQLRLINRGLTATKTREHLISPCLRLLTEVVSFDGGAVARLLYAKRDITFKRIEVFLTPRKAQLPSSVDEPDQSTLRRNAQRYVLSNLRFQHVSAKSDIIGQHKIIKAFLEYIRKDSRDIVLDIIKAIDRDIVQDASLSRSTKTKFFGRSNLEKLTALYGYDRELEEPSPDGILVANEIHKVLMKVCQDSSLGVLLPETGWFPTSSEPETLPTEDDESIELGLDSALYVDKFRDNVPVRNKILSHLAQVLRPDVDGLQIDLLIAIFKAAPELVADFFSKKTMLVSDPKPTPSWMGESTLLFSTVQLPVPENFGWKEKMPAMPPPISIVIENILPRPLSLKNLSRCLNQNTEIVTLYAIRILTVAFAKLRTVLKMFHYDHGHGQKFWNQAASKLVAEFCRRCPAMKDVILLYKRTAKEDIQQHGAVAELLSCFYDVVPEIAFEENFDVSVTLVDVLHRLEASDLSEIDSELLLNQLQSLLKIAQQSASLRWWQQHASMNHSAFTSVFKVLIGASEKESLQQIHRLLQNVLARSSVLIDTQASFTALISSTQSLDPESLDSALSFLDNCVCRVAKKPVHYLDMIDSLCKGTSRVSSPIVAAITEQWRFVVKNQDARAEHAVAAWIARLLGQLKLANEDERVLKKARDILICATADETSISFLKKSLKGIHESNDESRTDANISQVDPDSSNRRQSLDLKEIFGPLPMEGKTHNALHRWEKEELEVAIEHGRIAELMLCLCSSHEEVRRQAFSNISRFMRQLKESKYVEWRSVYILTGELLETVHLLGLDKPIPWIVGESAASCLQVLTNPLHKVYGKVNKFLQKAPSWELEKIPSYWIDKILLHEPDSDDGYFEEVGWLLDLLIHGLRTQPDMEVYRRANVFERVLSLFESPTVGVAARKKILHLIYRAAQVEGSTTLVTRAAAMSWIQSQVPVLKESNASLLQALARAIYKSADHDRIENWSGGALELALEDILA